MVDFIVTTKYQVSNCDDPEKIITEQEEKVKDQTKNFSYIYNMVDYNLDKRKYVIGGVAIARYGNWLPRNPVCS